MDPRCGASHYFNMKPTEGGFNVVYQPYTLRHDLDMYEDDFDPPVVILGLKKGNAPQIEGYSGPILIYPRKRYFKKQEVLDIWRGSGKSCHLCGKNWPLNKKGRYGWHIDHIIPHCSGGSQVEEMSNFKVACAICNLRKGKGWSEKTIRLDIHGLIQKFQPKRSFTVHRVK